MALLVGLSLVTYGVGGFIYWLARRKHLICPRCGLAWEHASQPMALTVPEAERPTLLEADAQVEPLPSAGLKRRVLGTMLILAASLLVLLGFVQWEMAAVAVGAAAGSLTFYWGWQGLQSRRRAVVQGLQRKILRLATLRGGTLTVTEVAAAMDLSLAAAEKILTSMDDGFRVRSEITDEGLLYYEFPELRHRRELGPGE